MRFGLPLLFLLSPAAAHAAGFYLTDVGTRGMGRGGAFVANPDSVLAMHYNPAGLSLLRGAHAELSLTIVKMDVNFQRLCPCVPSTTANAAELDRQLEAGFVSTPSRTQLEIPFLGIAYGIEYMKMTFGAAAWGPHSGRHRYTDNPPDANTRNFAADAQAFPGRYSGLAMKTLEANFGVTVAAEPLSQWSWGEGLRIGFQLLGYQSGNAQRLHIWANNGLLLDLTGDPRPENTELDVPLTFDFLENFGLNWSLGASYDIPFVKGLTIGTSFRAKRTIRTEGTLDIQLPRLLREAGVTVAGNTVVVELATAPLLRTGIEYQMPQVFRGEVAFVWEGWSAHDVVRVIPQDIRFNISGEESILPEIRADRYWRDTWSLRVGGELNLFEPWLGVRAGYYFEPTAILPERVDPSRIDSDKHGASLGLATRYKGFSLEVSGQYVILKDIEVRNGQARLIAPLPGTTESPQIPLAEYQTSISNGRYGGDYWLVSAALGFSLDEFMKP